MLSNKQKRFFELARKISYKSTDRFRLGCLITNGSRISNFGWNWMSKSHAKSRAYGNFLHSEVHALIGTHYEQTKGGEAYIYRETKEGKLADSKPCSTCLEALRLAGIKRIHFSTREGFKSERL